MRKLTEPLEEGKISLSKLQIKALGISVEDTINLRIDEDNFPLQIVSDFVYFPNLMFHTPYFYDDGYVDIWTLEMITNINTTREI